MKRKLFYTLCAVALAIFAAVSLTACADTASNNQNEETDMNETNINSETIDNQTSNTPSAENLLEAWDMADGGLTGTVKSSIGATDGTTRWGTWLPSDTFGMTLDFSTEGSYFKAADTKAGTLSDAFTLAAWVKAPPREDGKRTIISKGEYDPNAPLEFTDTTTFMDMNAGEGWRRLSTMAKEVEVDGSNGKCLQVTTDQNQPHIVAIQSKRHDISEYNTDNGYIGLHIYIDDASKLVTGQLELSSSSSSDNSKAAWDLSPDMFKSGWNDIYLPIKSATMTGECDFERINFIRIYMYVSAESTMNFDDITLCRAEELDKSTDFSLALAENTAELEFTASGIEGLESSGVALDDYKWHHVAVTLDGGEFTYYIDGEAVKTLTVTGALTNVSDDITAGAMPDATAHFDGSMAQLKIYNTKVDPKAIIGSTVIAEADNTFKTTTVALEKGIWVDTSSLQDVINCKDMGFGHVRIGFDPTRGDVTFINPDGSLNLETMKTLDNQINNCVRAGIPVIVAPHPVHDWKMEWIYDLSKFELVCSWYSEWVGYIAERWTPDQVAVSIMSEPAGGNPSKSWTWVSDRIYTAMRNAAPYHTILLGGDASGNIEHMKAMSPVTDDNVKYSFSTYEPYTIGFGTATTGMGGKISFWNYLADVPYPVPENLTDDEIEALVDKATEIMPAQYMNEARRVVRNYLLGVSDAGDHYVNNYGGVYNKEWHVRRAESIKEWQTKYGGVNVHVSEVGSIDGVQSIQYFKAVEGSGATKQHHYNHLRDLVETFIEYGFGYDYCAYNNPELTVFDTSLRKTYGNGISSDLALSWYDYTILDILQVTPVRTYSVPEHLKGSLVAIKFDDAAGTEEAESQLLLGIKSKYMGTGAVEYKDAYAATLAGDGSYIIASDNALALSKEFTMFATVKLDSTGKAQTIMSQAEGLWENPEYPGKFTLSSFDDIDHMWGQTPVTQGLKAAPAEGDNHAESTSGEDNLVVFCRTWPDAMDISAYEEDGQFHIWLYVEDASKLNPGAGSIEIFSDNNLENNVSWNIPAGLKTGWNELVFDMKDSLKYAADLTAINAMRIFHYTTDVTTLGIDELFICFSGEVKPMENWEMLANEQGELEFKSVGLTGLTSSGYKIDDGEWHDVAVSSDGETLRYYVDGNEVGSCAVSGAIPTSGKSTDIFFGSNSEHDQTITGAIAEGRVYNVAKTPAEITE